MVLEGGSQIVLNHLKAGSPCLDSFGTVIEDSHTLALQLSSCSFSYVHRKGNVVVDKLAKLAKHFVVPQIWVEPGGNFYPYP